MCVINPYCLWSTMCPSTMRLLLWTVGLTLLALRARADNDITDVVCPHEPVEAEADETVILNCHTEPRVNLTDDTVKWTIYNSDTRNYGPVLQYHQGEHTQGPGYENRAFVFIDQLSEGNCSLKLTVKSTDGGTYQGSVSLGGGRVSCHFSLIVRGASVGDKNPVRSKLISSREPIVAFAGDDVILPCHLEPPISASSETVMWTRSDLKPEFVHVHQDGRLLFENQNPSYSYRTRLFVDELISGNVSMKIFKVRSSDSGLYKCSLPSIQKEAFIRLFVHTRTDTDYSVVCPNSVEAEADETVILNCHTEPRVDLTHDTVEWTIQKKTTQKKDRILQYHQRGHIHGPGYENRASFFIDQLSEGNCSLKLTVKSTDGGTYYGFVSLGGGRVSCHFSLIVKGASGDDNPDDDDDDDDENLRGDDGMSPGGIVGIVVAVLLVLLLAVGVYRYRERLRAWCGWVRVPLNNPGNNSGNNPSNTGSNPGTGHGKTKKKAKRGPRRSR